MNRGFPGHPHASNTPGPASTDQTWPISEQWKFHLQQQQTDAEGALLIEAMFSIPTRRRPVPSATASVHFRVIKVGALGMGEGL